MVEKMKFIITGMTIYGLTLFAAGLVYATYSAINLGMWSLLVIMPFLWGLWAILTNLAYDTLKMEWEE
jgi:hypothetical protein